jgi:hypothetical protein
MPYTCCHGSGNYRYTPHLPPPAFCKHHHAAEHHLRWVLREQVPTAVAAYTTPPPAHTPRTTRATYHRYHLHTGTATTATALHTTPATAPHTPLSWTLVVFAYHHCHFSACAWNACHHGNTPTWEAGNKCWAGEPAEQTTDTGLVGVSLQLGAGLLEEPLPDYRSPTC